MAPSDPLITLQDVSLGYGSTTVLAGVSLVLRQGTMMGLVGPNGSGKTTLLKAFLGQLRPQAGTVTWSPAAEQSRVRFGYVPQHRQVDEFYPLSALEVVSMGAFPTIGPLLPAGRRTAARARQALEQVMVADLAPRPFRDLSGGQKQRVLVARALATGARTLLLDEPTNDMDLAGQHDLMALLQRLRDAAGLTIVVVSHMLDIVFSYVDELAVLSEGRVTPLAPHDPSSAAALSSIYGRPVEIVEHHARRAVLVDDPS